MIYTFKVKAAGGDEPLATVHQAHGVDVLGHARALIDKYPDCEGVDVMLLETRLFFLPKPARAGAAPLA